MSRATHVMRRLAILYQANLPPIRNGSQKPMKKGGYSDSGSDIACGLLNNDSIQIVTPVSVPGVEKDFDWVFPDTDEGIQMALEKGANVLWLNTVLYAGHPVENFSAHPNLQFVGQTPKNTDLYDNKWNTNTLLRDNGLPVPPGLTIHKDRSCDIKDWKFPLVLKPPLGRGSQGVTLIQNLEQLDAVVAQLFADQKYGKSLYIEPYLPGKEITVTVMPQGDYTLNGEIKSHSKPWALPAVERFNHVEGVVPYNGVVAVTKNSRVVEEEELQSDTMKSVFATCERAAVLVGARAPIRIDLRADETGKYWLFDLNMKPNMTGASREHRREQDSLTMLAARKHGWCYGDLLVNILGQSWKAETL